MPESTRVLGVLLYKNFLILKRQWKSIIFKIFLIPVVIVIAAYETVDLGTSTRKTNDTYYLPKSRNDLFSFASFNQEIYYSPKNDFTETLIAYFQKCLRSGSSERYNDTLHGYFTEEELMKHYKQNTQENKYGKNIVMVFEQGVNSSSKDLKYKIRSKNVNELSFHNSLPYMVKNYFVDTDKFVQTQICIDESFIKLKAKNAPWDEVFIQQMPEPSGVNENNEMEVYLLLSSMILITIAWIIPMNSFIAEASNEKCLGVNVLMSMNGVSNISSLLSWLISGFICISIFITIPLIILYSIFILQAEFIHFLYYANQFIIWLSLSLHFIHLLAYGLHISAYFSQSTYVTFGLIIFYGISVALEQLLKNGIEPYIPFLGVIFPNLLFFRGFSEIFYWERNDGGISFRNFFSTGNSEYGFGGSLGMASILSLVGIFLHLLFAIYVYEVNPGKYGVSKHPLFFMKGESKANQIQDIENLRLENVNETFFESASGGSFIPGIQIRNLKKTYNTSAFGEAKVHALKGVSIDFYQGQITSLLGHNGAGKTTMMSILTGMTTPTDGTILVNSKNMNSSANEIIRDMGLCTQENMVFPNLSVYDQLLIFALLKTNKKLRAVIDQNVKALLKNLRLDEKMNSLAQELSGGQKRRLCLGMALIGDASILVLDEPTSGLDPESRRVIWDILLNMRKQKTIIISTHDMEEADILGDNIAILHTGQLRSYGTPMFLKKLIGQGNVEVTLSIEPWSNVPNIRQELNHHAQVINQDSNRIVFSVSESADLPNSLDNLENKKKDLGILGLSVSRISLEKVFLKVTQDNDDPIDVHQIASTLGRKFEEKSVWRAVYSLLHKKMAYTLKKTSTVILILFLAILIFYSNYNVLRSFNQSKETKEYIPINLNLYDQPETLHKSDDSEFGNQYKLLTEKFEGKSNEAESLSLNEALLNYGKNDLKLYKKHVIAAAELNKTAGNVTVNALYSVTAGFSLPISINLLTNSILKSLVGDDYTIDLTSHQLPKEDAFTDFGGGHDDTVLIQAICLLVPFIAIFFPICALFVIHPATEFTTGVKQLQRMANASYFSYWGSMFFFDAIFLFLIVIMITIGFVFTDHYLQLRMFQMHEIVIFVLFLVLLIINILPITYTFSFINKPVNSITRILSYGSEGVVLLEVILFFTLYFAIFYYGGTQNTWEIVQSIEKSILFVIPYVSFSYGQLSFYKIAFVNARCRSLTNQFYDKQCSDGNDACCQLGCYNGECERYFEYFGGSKDGYTARQSLIYLCITPVLYFGILYVLENQIIRKFMSKGEINMSQYSPDDNQVKEEKLYVAQRISALGGRVDIDNSANTAASYLSRANNNNSVLLVHELHKKFGNFIAVKDVTFSVSQSECFGLLGVNGAGKSTAFKMMTGAEVPDNGVMYIEGKDFEKNEKYFLSRMGYCPQNDAIIECLNSYDHLRLFARLRGIPENEVETEVKTWISRLNLKACAAQPSGTYSGGNKRRLNIAIALIGNPIVISLDEPTTGVDPGARRSLWNIIKSCQTAGQAVVLTSHSMEECEVLCNRLGIMVSGKFVCFGSSEELKQKFGAGYDIEIKMNPEKEKLQLGDIKNDMVYSLNCKLVDEHTGYLMYHVQPSGTTWKEMYSVMGVMKGKYDCVEDVSVSSSTLEQLFLLFARAAEDK